MTRARNLSIQHLQRVRRLRTVISGQLPTGPVYQDGTFDAPLTVQNVSGTVHINGKKSAGAGKFIYPLTLAPSTTYTIRYDPDFTQLSNTGKDAMVGFGFRVSGNGAYHLAGLKGDGSTGLDAAKVTGTNFNTGAGTVSVQNAADHGTQAGPNYLRLITSADLATYTLESSTNGSSWTTEIASASLSLSAADFGIAAYFPATDVGLFTIGITVYTAVADATGPTISSSASPSVAENATLAHSLTANESVTWSIRTAVQNVASLDHDEFELSGSTLRWSSNGTRNYESPSDTNTDNAYVVVVRATDTAGNTTDQTITVTVTDVVESIGSAMIYTGNGTGQSITGAGFAPDLVIVKTRAAATAWKLVDAVRGVTLSLASDSNAAEATEAGGVTAFGADGFTVGNDGDYNNNGANFLALCLKETASAFDIVTYSGTGVAKTVAHGLGVVPELMIVKNRTVGAPNLWVVYPGPLADPAGRYLHLDTNAASSTASASTVWNSTTPTSSVFSVGTAGAVNANLSDHVAYLFASKAGVSKVGTYTGNGSTSGPTVTTNFRPKILIIKRTDNTGSWNVIDTARDATSPHTTYNTLDTSDGDSTATNGIAFTDTTFQIVDSTFVNVNAATYIYLALA